MTVVDVRPNGRRIRLTGLGEYVVMAADGWGADSAPFAALDDAIRFADGPDYSGHPHCDPRLPADRRLPAG